MNDQVICPNCKEPIPLTDALKHQIEDKIKEKYHKFVEEDRKKQAEIYEKKLQEEKNSFEKNITEKIQVRLERDMKLKLEDTKNESNELKQQNKNLQEQLLELNKLMRQLRTEKEESVLAMQKKLAEEETKIKEQAKKNSDEENRFKILEMEKKLSDAIKANEDLNRKLSQGSQQAQGEVLELEIEKILIAEFPLDAIKPVGKGITGADIVQTVKDQAGRECGTIVWETKRTKSWSGDWISKLKEDQRRIKAEIAVIVSEVLPSDVQHSRMKDGVWITSFQYFTALAYALRQNLLQLSVIRSSQVGKNEKMEILYNYLYGTEFQHRVEAILEAFTELQNDVEKEKRFFTQKWAKQERNMRKVIDSTVGMRGDLHSITGKELPEVGRIGLLDDGESKTDKEDPALF